MDKDQDIIRHCRPRQKRLLFLVALAVCCVLISRQIFGGPPYETSNIRVAKGSVRHKSDGTLYSQEEELTSLKAHLAHLKSKLASLGQPSDFSDPTLPVIYVITPTHARAEQKAELVRVSQTFLLVPNLHWIVVEDSNTKTNLVTQLLAESGLSYTHLNAETTAENKLTEKDPHWSKPRGVIQRNEALNWLRDHFRDAKDPNGVIYFADDDNTYHVKLFEEMRTVEGVGVWPVGLAGGLMVEKPKLGESPTGDIKKVVVGWDVSWSPHRPFAIDMAGFAVNLKHFLSRPKAKFAYRVKRGHQESEFLRHLVSDLKELEPRAEECTKVFVWHTRTEKPNLVQEQKRKSMNLPASDLDIEV